MKSRFISLMVRPALFFFVFCGVCVAQQNVRTIFLVRPAEKLSALPIASLTPEGSARAACLAQTLKDAGIRQVFVSEIKATQETAAPLANVLNIKPSSIPSRDVSTLVRNLTYGAAGNALVVAESDALPVIIARLQGGSIKPIGANEYDHLYQITLVEGGGTPAAVLHYCASPGSPIPATRAAPTRPAPKKASPRKQ